MFDFGMSEQFKDALSKLSRKDPVIARSINKKIKEIISRDSKTIHYYKNLTKDLKNFKRVHVTEWLVMLFEINLDKNEVFFQKIGHRDNIYKT